MAENYVTFKKFPDAASAKGLQQFLIENGIECLFADTSPHMGSAMMGELNKEYEVQLKPGDFEKAHTLLETHAAEMQNDLPEDYYIFTFTDEELFDIILKQEEWSEFDYLLARKQLEERGKSIDEDLIKSLRKQRMEDLSKPEGNQHAWIIFGYVASIVGGLFGIITGYVLLTSTKTLPNGVMVPTYSKTDRMHGKTILVLGIIMVPVSIAVKLWLFS